MTDMRWPNVRFEQMNSWTDPDEETGERLPITLHVASAINPKDDKEWGLMVSLNGHDEALGEWHRAAMVDAIREVCE